MTNKLCKTGILLVAGSLALGSNADTMIVTQKVDGVSWTINIDSSTEKAMIGPVTKTQSGWANAQYRAFSTPNHNNPSYPSIVSIPSSITVGETEYEVNKIGNRAFYGLGGITDVVIPSTVVQIYDYAFHACDDLKNVCLKGPVTVKKGQPQTYVSLARDANAFGNSSYTRKIELVLMGPNIKNGSDDTVIAAGATNMTVLLPNRSDNTTWSSFNTSDKVGSGNGNTVVFYGPGEDFDMTMGEKSVTVFPTTAASLAGALTFAPTFKKSFGLDVYISITNAITGIESVPLLSGGVSSDTLSWVTFVVSNQSQLNNTLAAVQSAGTLAVDASGAKENIVVPEGRSVAVAATTAETYSPNRRELVISLESK